MNGDLQFRAVPAGSGDAADLVGAMVAEMRELYDGLDLEAPDMPKAGPAELGPPGGVYLVGYRNGIPVCGGGLKRLPDGACEIKRMYVVPEARRSGVARALLAALEAQARAIGYEASGYRRVATFNDNPAAAFHGEKQLDPARLD
jgi:GNAT superfamily N-acetyltransferase